MLRRWQSTRRAAATKPTLTPFSNSCLPAFCLILSTARGNFCLPWKNHKNQHQGEQPYLSSSTFWQQVECTLSFLQQILCSQQDSFTRLPFSSSPPRNIFDWIDLLQQKPCHPSSESKTQLTRTTGYGFNGKTGWAMVPHTLQLQPAAPTSPSHLSPCTTTTQNPFSPGKTTGRRYPAQS